LIFPEGSRTEHGEIGPFRPGVGMIAARLWDVHDGKQLLVSRGIYRLRDNQKGKLVFQLFGNGWRFARGHTARLELTGSDATYVRASNFKFSVKVSKLSVSLPVAGG